ncbi:RRP15-like protein [Dendronephthya gigantea]|uniref:RRP15-like protein n=1 Tax=Dendronephthya gigantea TaxID=151771 RepID=UPI001069C26E|nr:RRP15-like protein [Dendronephthya gigantea]
MAASSDSEKEQQITEISDQEQTHTLDENENENHEMDESNKINGNPGWADAMARILTKPLPDDKPAVLIKYKKAERERKRKHEEVAKQKVISQEKHQAREQNHVKPAPSNDEKERTLRRIATKGVVKLFNAVNKHQKDLDAKLKTAPTEAKKAKVLKSVSKSSFLDMLKSNSNETVQHGNDVNGNEDKASKWDILREDFMMGGKMKDWDKDSDDNENENEENRLAVDFDDDESD